MNEKMYKIIYIHYIIYNNHHVKCNYSQRHQKPVNFNAYI